MYIGARYVPIFADPVEWDDKREYEPLTIVIHNGDCYTSKCYVPKGAQLPPYPEGQTKYWVKTSDYNGQFADLKKTVLDLSRLVEQFQKDNEHFTDLINGWNEKVTQWEKDMAAWGERLDTVESNVADLTASLNAEIARAKAAEQANAAAIAQETADRKQAISELDAAYKAADAAEAQAREAGDAANAAAIAQETADRKQAISELDAAYKAADAAEAQARADADTALSNRITANKTGIDALKAEQAIQNTNISKNAKNISDNAAEIAKHAARLTDLESNASDWDDAFPDTTIAQEVQKEELERANADTALNGRCDTLAADMEEVRDLANHKVYTTTYTEGQAAQDTRITALEGDNTTNKTDIENIKAKDTAQDAAIQQNKDAIANVTGSLSGYVKTETYTTGQAAQDAKITAAQNAANKANTNIGDWETDHPGQTISQCATSLENETAANAAVIGDWNAEHPGKTIAQAVTDVSSSIPDVSGFVTETTYNQGQAAQDAKINAAQNAANKANTNIGDWETDHPGQTISQCATSLENETAANAAKADANAAVIGDWNAERPGKTIAQAVTDVSSSIPDVSGFVTETTYNQGQAAQDAKIKALENAPHPSVPVNLDLVHGATPTAVVQTTEDYFTLTFQIANPAFSPDRTNYNLDANNITDVSTGYRVFILTSPVAGGSPTIVSSTLVETPTLFKSGDNRIIAGYLKVNGTKPNPAIIAVYWAGRVAGQITYKIK
jgi:chromosome segregation ATPase